MNKCKENKENDNRLAPSFRTHHFTFDRDIRPAKKAMLEAISFYSDKGHTPIAVLTENERMARVAASFMRDLPPHVLDGVHVESVTNLVSSRPYKAAICFFDVSSPATARETYQLITDRVRMLRRSDDDIIHISDDHRQPYAIPVSAGESIAQDYGYDQVIIIGRAVGRGEHVTTYGKDVKSKSVAAQIGEYLKRAVMGWPAPNQDDLHDKTDEWNPTHRHLKTGGNYRLLMTGSNEADLEPVAIYQGEDRSIWVRPLDQFMDGRFAPIERGGDVR